MWGSWELRVGSYAWKISHVCCQKLNNALAHPVHETLITTRADTSSDQTCGFSDSQVFWSLQADTDLKKPQLLIGIFRCARKKSSGERSSRLCTTVVHSCQNESWVVVVVSALVRSHHPSRSDKYQRLSFSFTWMQQFSQWLSCYDGRRPKVQAAVPFLFSFRRTSGSVCLAMPPIVVKSRDVPTHGAALHKNAAVIHHSFLCIRPPSLIWHNFFAFNRLSFSLLKCKSHSFSSSPNKCCDSDIS